MMKSLLTNRFTITFGAIGLIALVLNIYVTFHDDGILTGQILGPDGTPAVGAKVVLQERTLLVSRERDQTVTDQNGIFTFTGHGLHRIYLEAGKEGLGRLKQREYRLYFKGQNMELDEPLVLEAEQS